MNTVREIVKGIISDMKTTEDECNPAAARYYQRLAVLTYADFLKWSPQRTKEMNQQCLEECACYAERAISYGVRGSKIEESFEKLRKHWIPRLKGEKPNAPTL